MQEDMRLTFPARSPDRPKRPVEEAIVKVLRTRGTLEERERNAIQYEVKAGHCLVIDAVGLVDDVRPESERVEVRMIPQRGLTPEQEKRATVTMLPNPGDVVTLYATDWTAPFEPGVHVAREHWKRGVFRSATGVILGARPHPGSEEEIFIDLPEATARWVARQILAALDEPNQPARLVADEGYWKPGSTLEEAREAAAKTADRFKAIAEAGVTREPLAEIAGT